VPVALSFEGRKPSVLAADNPASCNTSINDAYPFIVLVKISVVVPLATVYPTASFTILIRSNSELVWGTTSYTLFLLFNLNLNGRPVNAETPRPD
jgi:hypothetical protein